MKLSSLEALVPDAHLREVLVGPACVVDSQESDVSEHDIICRLFSGDEAFARTLEIIALLGEAKCHGNGRTRLLQQIGYYALQSNRSKNLFGFSLEQIDEIVRVCARSLVYYKRGAEETLVSGAFSEYRCAFGVLAAFARRVHECPLIGIGILREIAYLEARDPVIASYTALDESFFGYSGKHIYDQTRSGREIPGVFFYGSDIKVDTQSFILFACPSTEKEAASMFLTMIQRGVRVIVGLAQHGEPCDGFHDFWCQNQLSKIRLPGDMSIQKVDERLLEDPFDKGDGPPAAWVKESTLRVRGPKIDTVITYLHYDGWKDQQPVPRIELLELIYERIEALGCLPTDTIAFHCLGGVNRSGIAATGLCLRRLISENFEHGPYVTINIPMIFYAFRQCRAGVLGNSAQLATAYDLAARHYGRLVATRGLGKD